MENKVSRRSFLCGSAMIAAMGTLGLAGCGKEASPSQGGSWVDAITWDYETDVVVIGYGGAGAAAAIGASDAGADVILLEKAPEKDAGGNTSVSGGGCLVGAGKEKDYMYRQFPDIITKAEIDAAMEELLSLEQWCVAHGAPTRDTAMGDVPIYNIGGTGAGTFAWLKEVVANSAGVSVMYSTPAKDLIFDPTTKEVFGVVAEENGKLVNIKARRGVIMTCGGFENNHQMLTTYYPPKVPMFPCGSPYNTGDGVKMVQKVGAQLRGFGSVEWSGHCCKKGSEEVGVALALSFGSSKNWANAILVNADGKRFKNETDEGRYAGLGVTHPTHAKEQLPELQLTPIYAQDTIIPNLAEYKYTNLPMFLICGETKISNGTPLFDAAGKNAGNHWANVHGVYSWSDDNQAEISKGWVVKADTLEELAKKIGVDPTGLAETVAAYDAGCESGEDEFGRTLHLTPIGEGPFYACELAMSIINTQGGPARDAEHRVLDYDDQPIKRLYAGGEFGSIYVWLYPGALNVPEALGTRVAGANAAALEPWDK